MGIPVVEGRSFDDLDNDEPARGAVIVSKAFADRFWPGERAIGKGVAPNGRSSGSHHVVGVVGDVLKSSDSGAPPLSQPAVAIYYRFRRDPTLSSNSGWWPGSLSLVVKTGLAHPATLFPAIRRAVSEADPTIPLARVRTMDDIVAGATAKLRFVSILLEVAAGVALLLAAVGLYGVISYLVARRTREIGMRLAIGAQPREVRRMVVGRSLALTGAGVVAGSAFALAATQTLTTLLVGIAPTDLRVHGLSALLIGLIALLASWLPAWRASRLDPVKALDPSSLASAPTHGNQDTLVTSRVYAGFRVAPR